MIKGQLQTPNVFFFFFSVRDVKSVLFQIQTEVYSDPRE